ncbi:hypothetical protein EMIHUDRAFT_445426 [Emiliania huxleyi CCMP1516]|uniref:Uncharacterized protein n=2 Tax=Emiliania huxleyi TaxID=2903 RepID=A0A0D3IYV8_EMIH1|nr:hypothetical protein EMIHUDRAFT_445426 [Emiliania huxleyi CCMP1516]EOD16443.1 hypothetical protein EMIHUDRAFT_445426 [Emiliania huxleyi CCMP1516]|eukprot:XP_005768872.1 hypothetical protein EMIHUDRAFT_445426 [Emiliania huxleyi CCMP1516]
MGHEAATAALRKARGRVELLLHRGGRQSVFEAAAGKSAPARLSRLEGFAAASLGAEGRGFRPGRKRPPLDPGPFPDPSCRLPSGWGEPTAAAARGARGGSRREGRRRRGAGAAARPTRGSCPGRLHCPAQR